MVKFYHAISNNEMWVADDRVEEYKAAGHKPAADAESEADKPAPKAKATRKRSK